MKEITIRKPDDFHAHLRTYPILHAVLEPTVRQFKRVMVMPNTIPPILTPDEADRYQYTIEVALLAIDEKLFYMNLPTFFMTIKLTEKTPLSVIARAAKSDRGMFDRVLAAKAYPIGSTTNSDEGVADFLGKNMREKFDLMAKLKMPLSIHAEEPGFPLLEREKEFLWKLRTLAECHPDLKIVMEHVTTKEAVSLINELPNLYGTITLHHLILTVDDVFGQNHNFCYPVAKLEEDREALWQEIMKGNPKFFFGSDSAPHPIVRKERSMAAGGVYSAPVLLPLLAEIFEEKGSLHLFQDFTSCFGANFYGLPLNEETITLKKEEWTVPTMIAFNKPTVESVFLVPFWAGKKISWSLS